MEISIKAPKHHIVIISFIVLVSIARILIQMRLPLGIMSNQPFDDDLLHSLALHLYDGDYLGKYDFLTLSKNYSYSYILAFCYKFLIPYPLLLSLLNIGSAFSFCQAIRKNTSYYARIIIYLLLIFSPITFNEFTALRVYRNSVLPYLALFVFSGYIAFFLRKDDTKPKSLIPWIIIESISLPLFWYIKEDSIWILPFCITISILTLIWTWINNKKNVLKMLLTLCLPFFTLLILTLVISATNYYHYGVFTTNDRSFTEAGKMYSNLFSIKDDSSKKSLSTWVSHNSMEKAALVSPTFAEIENEINNPENDANNPNKNNWTDSEGESRGDLFIWKIRYIMWQKGYYENAQKANDFCAQVNHELEEAFNNGNLEKDNLIHITRQMKGLTFTEILGYIPKALYNIHHCSTYSNLFISRLGSSGDLKKITTQQFLLGNNTYIKHDTPEFQTNVSNYQNHLAVHINKLISVYQHSSFIVNVLAVIGFIIFVTSTVFNIKKRNYNNINMFIVLCGIVLSAFLLSLEVELFLSWFSLEEYNSFVEFYSVSIYPLIATGKYISISLGVDEAIKMLKKRRKKD